MSEEHEPTADQMVKVSVQLDPPVINLQAEWLWALPVAEGEYQIRSNPFFVYGLNWGDVVRAHPLPNGRCDFAGLVRRGGHRTLRIIIDSETGDDRRQRILAMVNKYGGTYEHARGPLYAIDVPPQGDYKAIFAELDALEQIRALHFEIASDGTEPSERIGSSQEP